MLAVLKELIKILINYAHIINLYTCILNGVTVYLLNFPTIVLSIMALVIIIPNNLLKLFVYIHFQFGNSALSIARLKCLSIVKKLLVKHGAKEVSLYL